MVPTRSIKELLDERGFRNVVLWSRGVDTVLFNPENPVDLDLPRPVWIYVGRVAVEKNIAAFLGLVLPGSKVVIGEGPDHTRLANEYPDCHFLGYRFGAELAAHLSSADVFVFPSKTDTFGLVMLEAMACGLPVAALPATGPVDVVRHGMTGMLNHDLAKACHDALVLDRKACRDYAKSRSWEHATRQFQSHLAPIDYGGDGTLSPQTVK
jgi:glycosyltransferase involved in cell wall biosynthesis